MIITIRIVFDVFSFYFFLHIDVRVTRKLRKIVADLVSHYDRTLRRINALTGKKFQTCLSQRSLWLELILQVTSLKALREASRKVGKTQRRLHRRRRQCRGNC